MSASAINHFIEFFFPLNISCFDDDCEKGAERMSEQTVFTTPMAVLQLSASTTGGGAAFFHHMV